MNKTDTNNLLDNARQCVRQELGAGRLLQGDFVGQWLARNVVSQVVHKDLLAA